MKKKLIEKSNKLNNLSEITNVALRKSLNQKKKKIPTSLERKNSINQALLLMQEPTKYSSQYNSNNKIRSNE